MRIVECGGEIALAGDAGEFVDSAVLVSVDVAVEGLVSVAILDFGQQASLVERRNRLLGRGDTEQTGLVIVFERGERTGRIFGHGPIVDDQHSACREGAIDEGAVRTLGAQGDRQRVGPTRGDVVVPEAAPLAAVDDQVGGNVTLVDRNGQAAAGHRHDVTGARAHDFVDRVGGSAGTRHPVDQHLDDLVSRDVPHVPGDLRHFAVESRGGEAAAVRGTGPQVLVVELDAGGTGADIDEPSGPVLDLGVVERR